MNLKATQQHRKWVFFYMCVCMSWCCLRAVRERGREEGGSREGNRIGCQGERRLCLMRSHPGNLVTPPTQAPPPSLLPSFHLAPFECAHPLNPPPPAFAPWQRELSVVLKAEKHDSVTAQLLREGRRGTQDESIKMTNCKKRLGYECFWRWVEKHTREKKEEGQRMTL